MTALMAFLVFVMVAIAAFAFGSLVNQRSAQARLLKERLASERKAPERAPEEELALLDAADAPVPVPVVPEEEGELPVLTELVPAFTLWPTEPLTAVTVPAAGAMSVVLSTAV